MRTPLVLLLFATVAFGQHVAITNVHAHPVSSRAIEKATILVRDGLITAVGVAVDIPPGVPIVDATGLEAWPGFIDGWSLLGLTEVRQVRSTVDTGEMGDWQAHLRAASAINPHSEHIAVARVNGVTTAGVVAASGIIGGETAALDLFGRTVTEMTIKAEHPLRVLQLPAPSPRKWAGAESKNYWKATEKKWKKLEDYLKQARELARHLEEGVVDFGETMSGQDRLALRATARHLAGAHPWLVRADRRDHILAALRFALVSRPRRAL
jgi:imidazolonepropionase-like amidohydrolase